MEKKPLYLSKTLWFNLLAALLVFLDQALGVIKAQYGEQAYAWMVAVIAAGNFFLRAVTIQPVGLPAADPSDKTPEEPKT